VAGELIQQWQDAGDDPGQSPVEPSTDVGWFYRELMQDAPGLEMTTDARPSSASGPIWLSGTAEPPARVVGIRLSPSTPRDVLELILGLATKYDLVLFDARSGRIHLPLEEMAAHASATFWPAGAIQAAIAGGAGAIVATVAWFLEIPVLSGILITLGGFMTLMAIYTFIHEGRKAMGTRRAGGEGDSESR
jgi:hypothetical protein